MDWRVEAFTKAIDKFLESNPFLAYSPYLTYSDTSNQCFRRAKRGLICDSVLNPDTEAIWRIGHDAYALLKITSSDDFKARCASFKKTLYTLRVLVRKIVADGNVRDRKDELVTPDAMALDQREDSEILALAAHFYRKGKRWGELLAFACLQEVDNALIGINLDGRGAVSAAIHAANTLADAQACFNGSPAFRQVRKQMAYEAALARHRKDPKQAEKSFVFQCYQEWRSHPERYKSKADFARDMLGKSEHLTSQKKIEDWVRMWDATEADGTLPAE